MDQSLFAQDHNDTVAQFRAGHRAIAIERLTELFARGFTVSGRALFQIHRSEGRVAEAMQFGARVALADPMDFQFVQQAQSFCVEHAVARPVEYVALPPNPKGWSVVVCSHDDERYERFLRAMSPVKGQHELQFIRIARAATMGEGYAVGLLQARFDQIIFCHHDIEFLVPDTLEYLALALDQFDGVGIAGAARMSGPAMLYDGHPHLLGRLMQPSAEGGDVLFATSPFSGARQAAVIDGAVMVFKRSAIERIGFDASLPGFHYYDVDLCYRAAKWGVRLGVVPQIAIHHDSLGNFDESWQRSKTYFEDKHRFYGSELNVARHFYATPMPRAAARSVWQTFNSLASECDSAAVSLVPRAADPPQRFASVVQP
jgi:Glycosyltransferase like family